jgi:hypothetical protein
VVEASLGWEPTYSAFNKEVVGEDLGRHVAKEAKENACLAYCRRAVDTETMEENACTKHKHHRVNVDDQNDCFLSARFRTIQDDV